ncbi:MAG TPA: CHRD domain-containing protein, partial [Planctomycetota bacterium]|nr:CHRD domain-containing protein [Planctomycetota bacterium]
TGNATLVINADLTCTYNVTTTGLVGGTNAHLHLGTFGVAGGIEVPLLGGPTVWAGTSPDLGPDTIRELQNLGVYVNVHTVSKPGGEIRGQVVPSGALYGPSSDPPTGTITLASSGAPTDVGGGGHFTLSISHGKPFGTGSLAITLGEGAALLHFEPLLVNVGTLLSFVNLPLDGTGSLALPIVTPPLPASADIFLQFFGLDTSAPNGKFNASNGLKLHLQHF